MSKRASVAPKERINIRYIPATGNQQEEVELPLKTVILGDFNGAPDETAVEERKPVSIDKNTFATVLKEMGLTRDLEVSDKLSDDPEATTSVSLEFETLQDFDPDAVARKVPKIKTLLELREALTALKGPLGNLPQFRKALAEIVDDPDKRASVLAELESEAGSSDT